MKYQVYLDSRSSSGPRPSTAVFQLNQTIINAIQVKVLSFTFANTLFNVVSPFNTLVFSGGFTITVTPGFYDFADFINGINTQMLANAAFVTALGGNPNGITLGAQNNAIWTLGTNVLLGGGLYNTFLLQAGNYTSNFTTTIFLAAPQAIALTSPALQGAQRFAVTYGVPISTPFFVQHIESGFGDMEPSNSAIELGWKVELSHNNIGEITVLLTDPQNSRELTELSMWSILLEITSGELNSSFFLKKKINKQ